MAPVRALCALFNKDEEGGDGEKEEDAHQREGGPTRHGAREQVNSERRQDAAGDLVELNKETHWVPGFIGEKRFSNWLGNARDWAISRNRYWGSCIPVWINLDDPDDKLCIGSVEELQNLTGKEITDLHRHYLDDLINI